MGEKSRYNFKPGACLDNCGCFYCKKGGPMEKIVLEKVKEILPRFTNVENEKINEDSSFYNDLGLESLDLVELIMEVEDIFNLEIPHKDIKQLTTIKELTKYLKLRGVAP